MENKEVQEALDFLFDEAATAYDVDENDGELICYDLTNDDKYLDPANKIQDYIEHLERENKRLRERANPKKIILDNGLKFCPSCGDELNDNDDSALFEYCFHCGQKVK